MEMSTWIIYILIFISKISELTIVTLRTILTARDEKVVNTLLCFIQSSLWIVSTSTVIVNITEDPGRVIAFVLGCSAGCYIGMILDEKLAIGQNMITVIADEEVSKELIKTIRNNGFAVTVIQGKGLEKNRAILMIATRRKRQGELIKLIKKVAPSSMIIRESISTVGGYL